MAFAITLGTLAASSTPPAWVLVKPDFHVQGPKSVMSRGVNPCLTREPGLGDYNAWPRALAYAELLMPKTLQLGPHGEFDVVFHFHGREPARKEWVQAVSGVVWVGVDLGSGSAAYQAKFAEREEFWRLLAEVEDHVALTLGAPLAAARHIGMSSWSAGYGAIANILRSERALQRTDFIALLDGLHAAYEGDTLDPTVLEPFVRFARAAVRGDKLLYVTHSSITPPHYASTTETANYLIWAVGGHPQASKASQDPMGLDRIREYHRGGFHVVGFAGGEALDHCAQIGMLRSIATQYLAPRWDLPTRRP